MAGGQKGAQSEISQWVYLLFSIEQDSLILSGDKFTYICRTRLNEIRGCQLYGKMRTLHEATVPAF